MDKVTTTIIDWKSLVEQFEDLNEPHEAYEFSEKTFYEDDSNGVYDEG